MHIYKSLKLVVLVLFIATVVFFAGCGVTPKPTNPYITSSAGPHGSIYPAGKLLVQQGSNPPFTITPDTGYSIDDVLVDGSSVGAVSSYTFTNVTQDCTISATFSVAPSPTTIKIDAISGVTVPVAGENPVTAITATAQYTGTVTWVPTEDPFAEETAYTATITLIPKAGFTLTGVAENFFTVAGAVATNPTDSGVITAIFPATAAAVIDIAAIPGVTVPEIGATPVATIDPTAQYEGTVTWYPANDPFQEGKVYVATITLTAKAGFTLTGVAAHFFTVAGAIIVINTTDSGAVTAIFPKTLEVGDSYGGGIVAYILQPGEFNGVYYYDAGEQHGLIAATADQSAGIQWYNGSAVETGAIGTAIGFGQDNTAVIVAIQGAGSYAAKLCNDLTVGGYNDWFLPSKDELNKLYLNKVAIGGFADTDINPFYWSSSEYDADYAWSQNFNDGSQYSNYNKDYTLRVRAVRAF